MSGGAAGDCVLGNTSLDRFDAIVVGSGAGGSAVAYGLTTNGWKVLVLESGDNHFPGLDQPGRLPFSEFSNDEIKMTQRRFVWQDPLLEPRTFRQTEEESAYLHPDVNLMTRNVGGAAVISSVSYPRFTEIDFRLASALREAGRVYDSASFADWPFTYEDLEPYYVQAEQLSGVAGVSDPQAPGGNPFASWRSAPFPLPPQAPMYVGRVLANGARQLQYHPFNYPSAIKSQALSPDRYGDRFECVNCGLCTGYGCTRNAKGSPAVTTLRKALLTGNCQLRYNAHVKRVVTEPGDQRASGVEYFDPDGNVQAAYANHVVLAASPLESARLCFLSGAGGRGLGNSSGQLGRHVMFHFQTIAVGIFRQRLHGARGRSVTFGMADFRGLAEGGAELLPLPQGVSNNLGGVIEFGTSSEPIAAAFDALSALDLAHSAGLSLKDLLVQSPFHSHIAVMIMQGEDAPQPSNRIDLDPTVRDVFGLSVPRLTYRNHSFELDAAAYYKPKMLQVMEAAGAEFGFFQPFDPAVPPVSRHVLGGLRMGVDPAVSVCDAFGRFHDLENLYCADGGVFPTGSGYNPTPTIIATALRTAAAMVAGGQL